MRSRRQYAVSTAPAATQRFTFLLIASAFLIVALVLGSARGDAAVGPPSTVSSFPAASRSDAQLVFYGGPAENVATVDIDAATNEYLISDKAGLIADTNCRSTSRTTARCTRFNVEGTNDDRLTVNLDRGDDSFKMLAARSARVEGGRGADRITGSVANSRLYGDRGRDQLRGLGGEDALIADAGRDRLYGGPNDDSLRADNDDRDRTIACGPGRDKATIDRNLDPKPKNCERVRLR